MDAVLFNVQHFSYRDGPGIRTTLFFKGCPLSCAWCHNPEGKRFSPELAFSGEKCVLCGRCADVCPNGVHTFRESRHLVVSAACSVCGKCAAVCPAGALELIGRKWTVDEILAEVGRDAVFYGTDGGVTLSGGEPLAQSEALGKLLPALKAAGYHVCLETAGAVEEARLRPLLPYLDLILWDCKETDEENHKKWVGVGRERILSNLSLLEAENKPVILRCPLIPEVNDREAHWRAVGMLAEQYACITACEIEPYHPLGLSKAARLGTVPDYTRKTFCEKQSAESAAAWLRVQTQKPVRINF